MGDFVSAAEETNRWFGTDWDGALANNSELHIAVPVGEKCIECSRSILENHAGVRIPHIGSRPFSFFHRECLLKKLDS